MPADKPWLLLDFDGVFNVAESDQTVTYEVTIKTKDLPPSPFLAHHKKEEEKIVSVNIDPICKIMLQLLGLHYQFAWATTWEHAANIYWAPLLGLDELPVIAHSDVLPKFSEDIGSWKMQTIEPFIADKCAAWIDDAAWYYTDAYSLESDKDFFVVAPYSTRGIQNDHFEDLLKFALRCQYGN